MSKVNSRWTRCIWLCSSSRCGPMAVCASAWKVLIKILQLVSSLSWSISAFLRLLYLEDEASLYVYGETISSQVAWAYLYMPKKRPAGKYMCSRFQIQPFFCSAETTEVILPECKSQIRMIRRADLCHANTLTYSSSQMGTSAHWLQSCRIAEIDWTRHLHHVE